MRSSTSRTITGWTSIPRGGLAAVPAAHDGDPAAVADRRRRRRRRAARCRRRAATPSGTTARTAAEKPSERGTTTSAPKPAHQLVLVGPGVGDHPQPALPGQRDHVGGEEPGAAGDRQRLARARGPAARGRSSAVRPFIGSVAACSRLAPSGIAHHRGGGRDDQLGLGAALGPAGADRGHHLLADRQALDARARPTRSSPAASIPGVHGGSQIAGAHLRAGRCRWG